MENQKIIAALALIFAGSMALNALPVRTGSHYWDETVYLQNAEVVSGESPNNYNELDFRPPLLTLILAPLQTLENNLAASHLLLSFLSSASVVVLYLFSRELYSDPIALISSAGYALVPRLVMLGNDILIDPVLPLLWISCLYVFVRSRDRVHRFGAGAIAGICVLGKFTSLVLIPLLIGLEYLRSDHGPDPRGLEKSSVIHLGRRAAVIGVGALTSLSPYLLWNVFEFGNPIYTFQLALRSTGAPSGPWTYVTSAHLLVPIGLVATSLVAAGLRSNEVESRDLLVPGLTALAILLPMQLMSHKEPRYVLTASPFLAVCLSYITWKGSRKIGVRKQKALAAAGVVISFLFLASLVRIQPSQPVSSYTTQLQEDARWASNNVPDGAEIQLSFNHPVMAYYSKKPVNRIRGPLNQSVSEMEPGDIVYYSEESPFSYINTSYMGQTDEFERTRRTESTAFYTYLP